MAASGGGTDGDKGNGPAVHPGLGGHSRHGSGGGHHGGGGHHHHHTSRHRRHKHHTYETTERKLSPFEEKSENSGSSLGPPPPTKPKPAMIHQLQAEERKYGKREGLLGNGTII